MNTEGMQSGFRPVAFVLVLAVGITDAVVIVGAISGGLNAAASAIGVVASIAGLVACAFILDRR